MRTLRHYGSSIGHQYGRKPKAPSKPSRGGRLSKKSANHPNLWTNGKDYNVEKGSVEGFMRTHNKAQRLYMHALLHSPSAEDIPDEKRRQLHDAIVRKDIKGGLKGHKTPI